jgi:tRNA A-37 threonylcarbamoyl transferase component Bud32
MSGIVWALLTPGILLLLAQVYLCARAFSRVPRLHVQTRYRRLLEQHDLAGVEQFLALPGPVVSGHPDRHVAKVTLADGPAAVRAFLKREHVSPWKERIASAWLGHGFVSKSCREFQTLEALRDAGVSCPEPVAAGEDGLGRAFVLVREVPGAVDLRAYLRDHLAGRPAERHRFVGHLAEALARIHDAGFAHRDLYSEHVLVDPQSGRVCILDWQRSGRRRIVHWPVRWRDLAALHATLADSLATGRERIACFIAYLRASLQTKAPRSFVAQAAKAIEHQARQLRKRRRIREMCDDPPAVGAAPGLVWLDGEALCVTVEFLEEMQGQAAAWLGEVLPVAETGARVSRSVVPLPGLRQAQLVYRRTVHPFRWLWASLRRHRLRSPETQQAGTYFRLRQLGLGTPRLLAVGQRHLRPWRTESFVLTEGPAEACPLTDWLAGNAGRSERAERWRLVQEAGVLFRRLHDAGYQVVPGADQLIWVETAAGPGRDHSDYCTETSTQARSASDEIAAVPSRALRACVSRRRAQQRECTRPGDNDSPPRAIVLGSLEAIRKRKTLRLRWIVQDLRALRQAAAPLRDSWTDELRFLLAYMGCRRLTPAARKLIQRVCGKAAAVPILARLFPFSPAAPRAAS